MMASENSVYSLFEIIKQKAPEYLKLLSAASEDEFEKAFDTMLGQAVERLEENSKNFKSLDEVGLTGVLAAALSIPGLTVTQEAHSNGHVDLTIEADHCTPTRKKLGEAKIYNGPAYHIDGLSQLLDRYTTGREGHGILIAYVRKKNIAGLVKGIRDHMDKNCPCQQQGVTSDHILKWSFRSKHTHTCGENLQVDHIGCNLYVQDGTE